MNIPLKPEDYYRYNAPFRQWLFDCKGAQLGDFKADESKQIFANEFIPAWNSHQLPKDFYTKGPNYKTDFSKKPARDNLKDEFGFSKSEESRLFTHKSEKPQQPTHRTSSSSTKTVDKAYLKRRAEDLDELVPKKEGHAKVIEDRRIKSAHTRIERNTPHDLELSDTHLFATKSSDDYATLLRLEKEKKARKEREISERKQEKDRLMQDKISKYNQREVEVQEMLKKMICKK